VSAERKVVILFDAAAPTKSNVFLNQFALERYQKYFRASCRLNMLQRPETRREVATQIQCIQIAYMMTTKKLVTRHRTA